MMPVLIALAPAHATDAARLHILGQPGTFLTSLGPDVLAALYRALPRAPGGFGYALAEPGAGGALLGFVAATTSFAALLLELATLRLPEFGPPLARRLLAQPELLPRAAQTILYPLQAHEQADPTAPPDPRRRAELLAIMVEPQARGQGGGSVLLHVLAEECRRRGIDRLDVTVDAGNSGARRFYTRHGFTQRHTFTLYGRMMCLYALELTAEVVA